MAKKINKSAEKKILRNMTKAAVRKDAMEQGAYDGRFRPRVIKSKKIYSRKKRGPKAGE